MILSISRGAMGMVGFSGGVSQRRKTRVVGELEDYGDGFTDGAVFGL